MITANINRRQFLKTTAAGAVVSSIAPSALSATTKQQVPGYLKDYSNLYSKNPRKAAIEWFRNAKFGLFMHYGLYSIPAGIYNGKKYTHVSEWLQYWAKIHVKKYAEFAKDFTAENFDADAIADIAVAAEMKYINITSRHHDSFCLWNTKETNFNTVNTPAKRDIIKELAEACRKRDLGLCLYYSHGRDWRHPHAPNNDCWGGRARPEFKTPDPAYKYGKDHDLQKYVKFIKNQITELLTNYGPITAIWLDGIGVPFNPKGDSNLNEFHCQDLYDHIHNLQPQVLVSYKQGLLGTEDFKAPEHKAVEAEKNTPIEICTTLQKGSWGFKQWAGWRNFDEAKHKLGIARKSNANLLLNVGPKGDGTFPAEAAQTLRKLGTAIRRDGWPTA